MLFVAELVAAVGGELFPPLLSGSPGVALRLNGSELTFAELAHQAGGVAERLGTARRVAVHASPTLETIVGVVGALAAGAAVVAINPGSGPHELEHVLTDSAPDVVLEPQGASLPAAIASLPTVPIRGDGAPYRELTAEEPERTALIVYTSGTTGPPKGVQIPRRAIISNLDALARAWGCTRRDRLVHALPLFHIHGLVLGVMGSLRIGGAVDYVDKFSPERVADAMADATMFFGVPTMFHRIADACARDPEVAAAFANARLLVSGSAPLPAAEHARIEQFTGQRVVERYGMTETLITVAVRADQERLAGHVGLPVDGVALKLIGEDGREIHVSDGETMGEIAVRGPSLFTGYLNRPDATAEAMVDGWFLTGDIAVRAPNGYIRIVGRSSTDLIKSGGYKIGAGEIEAALADHEAVSEVAVKGLPDEDLGERVVAWVVRRSDASVSAPVLSAHVGEMLATHKRPREIRFVDALPRNAMGKVIKAQLDDLGAP